MLKVYGSTSVNEVVVSLEFCRTVPLKCEGFVFGPQNADTLNSLIVEGGGGGGGLIRGVENLSEFFE